MLIIIFIFLAGCSKGENIQLISSKADIVTDKAKTGEIVINYDNKETTIIPTSLYYEFKIKSKGIKIESLNNLQIKIEPSIKLDDEIQKVVGKDIFSKNVIGYGWGLSPIPSERNEVGIATVYYHLGTYNGNSKVPSFPMKKKLMAIKNNALNANLVLILDNKEVARFNLSEQKWGGLMAQGDYYLLHLVLLAIIIFLLIINIKIRSNQLKESKDIEAALYKLIEITKFNKKNNFDKKI